MVFDILFVLFIGLGFYQGYKNGIIYSVISFLAYFIGIMLAVKFTYLAVKFLHSFIQLSPGAMKVLGFIFVFILVLLMARVIAWLLEQVLKAVSLNVANQLAGGVLHAVIGLYVMCVLIWYIEKINVIPRSQKEKSHVYGFVHALAPDVMLWTQKAIPALTSGYQQFEELVGRAPAGDGSI